LLVSIRLWNKNGNGGRTVGFPFPLQLIGHLATTGHQGRDIAALWLLASIAFVEQIRFEIVTRPTDTNGSKEFRPRAGWPGEPAD
jgi:hypothetical protein